MELCTIRVFTQPSVCRFVFVVLAPQVQRVHELIASFHQSATAEGRRSFAARLGRATRNAQPKRRPNSVGMGQNQKLMVLGGERTLVGKRSAPRFVLWFWAAGSELDLWHKAGGEFVAKVAAG